MSRIIDGKRMAAVIQEELKGRVASQPPLKRPGLAVVVVGDNHASAIYVRRKEKACSETGIRSRVYSLPERTPQAELGAVIDMLNESSDFHGILIQLPLPEGLNSRELLASVRPEKDVDGFHPLSVGRLWTDRGVVKPCTPSGIMQLIDSTGVELEGKEAVVVGRSDIVGKPTASMLLSRNCTVTICHSRTSNLPEITRRADILVAAAGKPGLVTGDMIKSGAVVIDAGINRTDAGIVGDVDFASASEVASWITPVPGGVGPMTIAMLLKNTVELAGL
jgi:methylenetetrahydrofolate dehydrogenase (NADP+)/methenyltetrahydrofolate cyclohydrolase